MSVGKGNVLALIFVIPIILVSLIPYVSLWDMEQTKSVSGIRTGSLMVAFLVGIIIHELIHGLYWGVFAKEGFRSIKFGVIWKALTPYCHCKEALKVKHYRIGILLPTIILGFLPIILSWITGRYELLIFGIFLTIGGGGDFLIVWMMRKLKKEEMIKDHPYKLGFYIPEEE